MKTGISIWNAVIRHSGIWYPVTSLHVLLKKDAIAGFGVNNTGKAVFLVL